VTGASRRARPAVLVGLAVGLTAGIDLVRWIRPALLTDPDTSWAGARLLLGFGAACGAAAAGGLAAAAFLLWSRTPSAAAPLEPLPIRRGAAIALMSAAILVGTALRFVSLSRLPEPLWVDDLSLIRPALALSAAPSDFADSIRAAPYGASKPYGSVGVLYLEGYRAALRLWGTTVFGVRFPSALAGSLSLATAALLGRALLPAGGGTLAALALAGMRWALILSRWAWNMIVLAPLVDVATLLLVSARRRGRPALAAAAGLVAGVGAHVYLSAWPAAAALLLFAAWPSPVGGELRARLLRACAFAGAFALAAAPLFLLREGRSARYFARTADHNVRLEMARTGSTMPPVAAAADTLAAPWFLPDPTARHDLPGRSRLGWLLGIPVALSVGRALLKPREPLSALLLAHALAVLAAVVAGGQADHPNGARFAYLTSVAAVAAAAGWLWIIARARPDRRRAAACAAIGALAVGGALSARDALVRWPADRATFDGFHGQDTLIGRAAARWDVFGDVRIAPGLGRSALAIEAVRAYRLDPDDEKAARPSPGPRLRVRIAAAASAPTAGERVVERVRDAFGREWARVFASPGL
jgi:hypothetical protein